MIGSYSAPRAIAWAIALSVVGVPILAAPPKIVKRACVTCSPPQCAPSGARPKIVKRASVDLDGDRKLETVSIAIHEVYGFGGKPDYVLRVGKAEAGGHAEGVEGFAIVDLDTSDKRKEVAVFSSGPSDDPAYQIYTYEGKRLRRISLVAGQATFPGNRTVLVDSWHGSWEERDKYVLVKATDRLVLVPQELHWVNQTVTVAESFPIYRSRGSTAVVANLRVKTKILLVAVAPPSGAADAAGSGRKKSGDPQKQEAEDYMNTWFLVKSESNLLGWAQLKTLYRCTSDMPCAD